MDSSEVYRSNCRRALLGSWFGLMELARQSVLSFEDHWEQFHHWASSALLAPVLLKVYRRFGIAGLCPRKTPIDKPELVVPSSAGGIYGACLPVRTKNEFI